MLCVEQLLVRLSACLMLFNKSQGRTTYYLQAIALEGLLHNVLCSLAYLVQCLLVYILLVCQGLRGSFQCLAGSNQQCLIQAFKMPNLQRLLQLQVQQLLSAFLYSVIYSYSSLLFLHVLILSVKLVICVRNLLLLHVSQDCNKGQLASCVEYLLIGLLVILYIIRQVCSLSACVSATFLHINLVILLLIILNNALYTSVSVPISIRIVYKSIITLL